MFSCFHFFTRFSINVKLSLNDICFLLMEIFTDCSNAFNDALNQWSGSSKLTFKKIESGSPIMNIRFVTKKHSGCPIRMDGPGKLLITVNYFLTPHWYRCVDFISTMCIGTDWNLLFIFFRWCISPCILSYTPLSWWGHTFWRRRNFQI